MPTDKPRTIDFWLFIAKCFVCELGFVLLLYWVSQKP